LFSRSRPVDHQHVQTLRRHGLGRAHRRGREHKRRNEKKSHHAGLNPPPVVPPNASSGRPLQHCHGDAQGLARANQHHQFLAARDRGVQKAALEHHVVLRVHRHDHSRILRALRLVHRRGVGQGQLVQVIGRVTHLALVETDHGLAFTRLVRPAGHAQHLAHVAVEHVAVVVVANLHHAIADAKTRGHRCAIQAGPA